jgi:hypothetical protein
LIDDLAILSFVFWLSTESQSLINKDNDISNTLLHTVMEETGPRKERNQVIWKNSCSVPGAYICTQSELQDPGIDTVAEDSSIRPQLPIFSPDVYYV